MNSTIIAFNQLFRLLRHQIGGKFYISHSALQCFSLWPTSSLVDDVLIVDETQFCDFATSWANKGAQFPSLRGFMFCMGIFVCRGPRSPF